MRSRRMLPHPANQAIDRVSDGLAYRSDRFTNFIESPYRPIESSYSLLQARPVR